MDGFEPNSVPLTLLPRMSSFNVTANKQLISALGLSAELSVGDMLEVCYVSVASMAGINRSWHHSVLHLTSMTSVEKGTALVMT